MPSGTPPSRPKLIVAFISASHVTSVQKPEPSPNLRNADPQESNHPVLYLPRESGLLKLPLSAVELSGNAQTEAWTSNVARPAYPRKPCICPGHALPMSQIPKGLHSPAPGWRVRRRRPANLGFTGASCPRSPKGRRERLPNVGRAARSDSASKNQEQRGSNFLANQCI